MPKISIITPSIRKEGLKIVQQALKKQAFKDFEWLIGSPFDPEIPEAKWVKDDFEGGFWTLNRIYNKLFQEAKGEIIVTWQDWIYAKSDALEKFVNNVKRTSGVVSGVGHQYQRLNKWGKPEIKIWSDPRKTDKYGSFYEVNSNDAEWNFCAFRLSAARNVGGMDNALDFLGYVETSYKYLREWTKLEPSFISIKQMNLILCDIIEMISVDKKNGTTIMFYLTENTIKEKQSLS